MLFHIAELMPTDAPSLLACCNPIPPLVKQQTADLVLLVQRARDPSDASATTSEQRPVAPLPVAPAAVPPSPAPAAAAPPAPKYAPSPSPPPHALSADSSPVLSEEALYRAARWTPVRAKLAEANAGYHSGAARLSSLLGDSTSSSSDDDDDAAEARSRVAQVRAALAADPALPPSLRSASAAPPTPVAPPAPAPAAKAAAAPAAAPEKEGVKRSAERAAEEEEEKIPQTLSEIYQLSNKNRKRNKEKKKRKEAEEEAAPPEITSPVQIADDADEEAKRKKHKKTGSKDRDTMEFMRQIGWVGGRPQPSAVTTSTTAPAAPFSALPRHAASNI